MKKEIVSLDVLRILAGFFVVFIHATDKFILFDNYVGGVSWWVIYILNIFSKVAVPLFIIISGYLVLDYKKTKDLKAFYKKRFSRVGIPLLLWLIIFFSYQILVEKTAFGADYLITILLTVAIGPLYFLVVISELYLIAPFLSKILNKGFNAPTTALVFFLILDLILFLLSFNPTFYKAIGSIFTIFLPYIFYFFAGGFIRQIKNFRVKPYVFLGSYFLFSTITVILVGGNLNSVFLKYQSPLMIISSVSFFLAFLLLENYFQKTNLKIKKILTSVAGAIFGVFLIHPYVIEVMEDYTIFRPGNVQTPIWGYVILGAIIAFIVSFIIVFVGKKIPYVRLLFG